jgi:sugar phosphate isomerase/epimerase
MRTVYCGEGEAMVREIIEDLLESGYDGFVSIEPHIAAVVHTGESSDPETMYRTYVEYGRRLNEIVAEARRRVGG